MLQARQLHGVRQVIFQSGCWCAWAWAVDEAKGSIKTHIVNEFHHFLEIIVRLTRKPNNEVTREHHVGTNRPQFAYGAFVFQSSVAAFHGTQNTVRAMLHW